ncbi:NUDIX hydrolase [Alkalihalobacillus pseudalcaliphilus]|uniref:NUDIX hydrolase n=1 Tax=Alkalihalobacillus pseudalcaliphilus TaxID=79884 RepID=UPI00064E0B92|nr:NUDIX domain-containing protein [Alkalihalobacillus pseudalcaliphilus]KMK77524.1 DNA mismatch repair protein MutT [Alkalihalobacillus pseudalcaliphilus]
MDKGYIRPISIGIFRKQDTILVFQGFDAKKQSYYYRPIGGGIEYGEKSVNTLKRELLEELGADITNIHLLGVVENIFTDNENLGHEIVFVHEATFVEHSFYEKTSLRGYQDDGEPFLLYWKSMSDFKNGKLRLVPDGLTDLL